MDNTWNMAYLKDVPISSNVPVIQRVKVSTAAAETTMKL